MSIYRHIADRETLAVEYSPSSRAPDMAAIVASCRARSKQARQGASDFRTYAYGDAAPEALDFFPPALASRSERGSPALVYLHGGYWQELSKEDHSFPTIALAPRGIAYIAVNYGLAPAATLDAIVDRCRRALAWVVLNSDRLGIDAGAICVAGSSAGAHLAAMMALTDWTRHGLAASPIRSLCLLSGVFDLRPLVHTYVNDALGMSPSDAERNSPLLLLQKARAAFPPTLVAYGENETSEFKRQSRDFSAALRELGARAETHEVAGRNHFDLILDIGVEGTALGDLTLRCMECAP